MIRKTDHEFVFKNQTLILTPEKALFWRENRSLILSDLHLGKSGHFRKHGVPVPNNINSENLIRLERLVDSFNPDRILFLGDLFHSEINDEWESFAKWRDTHPQIMMLLAIGNHDYHSVEEYNQLGLLCSSSIEAKPFMLVHDAQEAQSKKDNYLISGHIHPSIRMRGKGRQAVHLPCYYFGEEHALLPAFGNFTGTHTIKPVTIDKVFAIIDQVILPIS